MMIFDYQIWLQVDEKEGLYKLLIGTDVLDFFKEEAAKYIKKYGENKLLFFERIRLEVVTSVVVIKKSSEYKGIETK